MIVGEYYNWKNAPWDQLVYLGKKGSWHQFKKVGDPREVWCEVLDEDLALIEPMSQARLSIQPFLY